MENDAIAFQTAAGSQNWCRIEPVEDWKIGGCRRVGKPKEAELRTMPTSVSSVGVWRGSQAEKAMTPRLNAMILRLNRVFTPTVIVS